MKQTSTHVHMHTHTPTGRRPVHEKDTHMHRQDEQQYKKAPRAQDSDRKYIMTQGGNASPAEL